MARDLRAADSLSTSPPLGPVPSQASSGGRWRESLARLARLTSARHRSRGARPGETRGGPLGGYGGRRYLLDLLFARDGRTLTELESNLAMTRFGVMKHLKVLEEANLVVRRRSGGSNGAPPDQGGGGWPWILSDLKTLLETGTAMVG